MSTSAPEQPTPEGQDPQTAPDPTPAPSAPAAPQAAPPAPSPAGDGPWSQDLAQRFQDEATRAQVDEFLRSTVQPRVTQLEQAQAQYKDAHQLWDALAEDPYGTYVAMTGQLLGEDAAAAIQQQLYQSQQQGQEQAPQYDQQGQPALDPRQQQINEWVEQQQTQQYYDSEMNRITQEHPEVHPDLFHPFVAAADGDFNHAYQLWTEYQLRASQQYPEPQQQDVPPPALGSDVAAAPATPTEPRSQSLDEAVNEFMADIKAGPAPPVGTT